MSRFTDLFQPKPEPVAPVAPVVEVENREVDTKSDNVPSINRWKRNKIK